jgi:Fructose-1,6-bisphosphate aldolase
MKDKTVYIVGDITKDVYLRLDNRRNQTYQDEKGVFWMDLPFDNKIHRYFRRTSVYGGAAVSADVLNRFGARSDIAGCEVTFDDYMNMDIVRNPYNTYRYIICKDDDTAVFAPSGVYDTIWTRPTETPDYVYIDRPCVLDEHEKSDLLEYLHESPEVGLAMWVNKELLGFPKYLEKLASRSEVIFVAMSDLGLEGAGYDRIRETAEKLYGYGTDKVVLLEEHEIYVSTKSGELLRSSWNLGDKDGLFTSLTTKAIISSSFLGGCIRLESLKRCLLLAKYNVETSTLNVSTSIDVLCETIKDKEYEVEIMESNEIHDGVMTGNFKEEISEMPNDIREIAKRIVAIGKGILAADESGGSMHKKFEERGIEDTEQSRRNYRNIFFTTEGLEDYVNGIILFDETARQLSDDGRNFVEYIASKGIVPGIKVDKGLEEIPGFGGEKVTLGLDELKARLKEYHDMGCRFAKWRAAFEIGDGDTPSNAAIAANVQVLARYALDCQEAGIVPIVEPELVYDGNYTIEQNKEATSRILYALFSELDLLKVDLEATVLKVNMVLAGKRYETQSTAKEIGAATAEVLREQVPEKLAGVVFLSGGQSVTQATENLQAVTNNGPFPWPVTFSFARALQDPAVETWLGKEDNVPVAREAFKERLVANCEALIKKN